MVAASLPVQVLFGIYLGILTGLIPALISWTLGFVFKYFTSVTIPGLGVVVLALAVAGVNGGLLALNDPTVRESQNEVTLTIAIVVVLMLSLYAHAKGDKMGAELPRRVSLRELTQRTLSTDVVELVGGRGQVTVETTGDVADMEGYPPLPAELRAEIRQKTYTFPADLPVPELETRVADSLRSDFDLADVSVRLDERAKATVAAAPPVGALSKRVPSGKRAVSVQTLVPTGLARGDDVVLASGDESFRGVVLSVKSGEKKKATDGGEPVAAAPSPPANPTATGGEGRVTVSVDRSAATTLMARGVDRLTVSSRGKRREFELVSVLRRAGKRFRRVTPREGGPLDGETLADVAVRDTYDVVVLAVRADGRWRLAPGGDVAARAGEPLYAVGSREALAAFEEAVA